MKLEKIVVKNFRLLKDFTLNLEDELSLVLGKNNTGKTSILRVLDYFINNKSFHFDDLSNEVKTYLIDYIDNLKDIEEHFISLSLFIKYDDNDNLSNIRYLMQDLDPNNDHVILNFQYTINEANHKALIKNFIGQTDQDIKKNYLRNNFSKYFKREISSVLYNTKTETADFDSITPVNLSQTDLMKIINFKYIDAKRLVQNDKNRILSNLAFRYYEIIKKNEESQDNTNPSISKTELKALDSFKNQIDITDKALSKEYKGLFRSVIEKVKKFGGIKANEIPLNIESEIRGDSLLKDNITVMYEDSNIKLPEYYNGLGYLNLLSIIFEIESTLIEFRYPESKADRASDINILFIEEPEAHTHPQMQYVFIKNIKDAIKENSEGLSKLSLQTIMSTHSSHIVSGCDFKDIKYLQKIAVNSNFKIISKDLKDLEIAYKKENNQFKFLKQYLTIDKADLFFADKVIFIEGATERILLPAMMKKIDDASEAGKDNALLSQNISIVEIGTNSKAFEEFIAFLDIKTLIITDIDYVKASRYATSYKYATGTSNSSIKHFYELIFARKKLKGKKLINYLLENPNNALSLKYNNESNKLEPVDFAEEGNLLVAYQYKQNNGHGLSYYPRSFEDAFVHLNIEVLERKYQNFKSLSEKKFREELEKQDDFKPYEFVGIVFKGISKPSFAMDILLHCDDDWIIPPYIEEGLKWLRKD